MTTLFDKEKVLVDIPIKDKGIPGLVIAFPNTYSIGMASLGYQTAWKLFNQHKDIHTTRWFTDIKEKAISTPLSIGFSFSWELDYKNILEMLEKNNIPIYSKERKDEDPLIFAGGVVPNANPMPFVSFFDFFLLGDLEAISQMFLEKLHEIKDLPRKKKLEELSKLPCVFVPNIQNSEIKKEISKNSLAYSSILTGDSIWPDTFVVEVVRSCPELCRFCLASYGSLPFRTPSLQNSLIPLIDLGLKYTNKIGLMGASVTQHPEFEGLIDYLIHKKKNSILNPQSSALHVQVASVRADTITKSLAKGLHSLDIKSVTMAVETGSDNLRDIINKKVSNETIIQSIQTLYSAGISSIKLYGMVGLPHETEDDLLKTIEFLKEIRKTNKGKGLTWGCSVFVPKASTPFQWYGIDKTAEKKLKLLAKELHKAGISFKPDSYKWALIQGLISRGDAALGKCLEKAYRYGSTLGSFNRAFKEENIDIEHYMFSNWESNTKFPWDNLQGHLSKEIVFKHKMEVEKMRMRELEVGELEIK